MATEFSALEMLAKTSVIDILSQTETCLFALSFPVRQGHGTKKRCL